MNKINKLSILFPVLVLGITSLMGCNGKRKEGLYLYSNSSRLVINSFEEGDSRTIPTYHYSPFDDVAYVKLDDLVKVLNQMGFKLKAVNLGDGVYGIKRNNDLCMSLNTNSEELIIQRMDLLMFDVFMDNNGVVPDISTPFDSPNCAVHTSEKSKYLKEFQQETYDLSKYNFDLLESENSCYVPFQLLSNIIFRESTIDFVYNGIDYYFGSIVTQPENIAAYISYYSGNKKFMYDGHLFKQAKALDNEKYRFVSYNESIEDAKYRYQIFSFLEDGNGALVYGDSSSSKGTIYGSTMLSFSWRESNAGIYAKINELDTKTGYLMKDHGTMKIAFDKGYFATEKRSDAVAKYSYNLLRFHFDNTYGLKDVLTSRYGYTDFESFVKGKKLYGGLLSKDSHKYDEALSKFLLTYVDDGHTSYKATSIYSCGTGKTAQSLSRENYGERHKSLVTKYQEYVTKRNNSILSKDKIGLFTYDETAVIRFDEFAYNNNYIVNSYPEETSISSVVEFNSAALFDLSFTEIQKNSNIKNVVIDLTCNSGGLASLLPYMAAFFTDDPVMYYKNPVTKSESELHYQVDLNHDGTYGGEGDTYKDKYNFYILTSDFSFSCGTALPTIAKNVGVTTIGKQSGGGACPVGAYSDGSGSIYTSSIPTQICLNDNGTLSHNDNGVPPTYNLDMDSWYSMVKLNTFVKNLSNKGN